MENNIEKFHQNSTKKILYLTNIPFMFYIFHKCIYIYFIE